MNLEVLSKYKKLEVKAGTILFKENDPGDFMYVILDGQVLIYKRVMEGVNKTLSTLTTGEYFGEMSLLLRANRTATAEVIQDAVLVKLDQENFREVLRESPETGIEMLTQMARRLEKSNEEAIYMALELALLERKPADYKSIPSRGQLLIATGSFEMEKLPEVLRLRKEVRWSTGVNERASVLKVGSSQDALIYLLEVEDLREVIKLILAFKGLVRWDFSLGISPDEDFIDTLNQG
ncbi:MAG TPA: cyclic nucleotide-binding domain-containing protein [Candidatus Limnocylindrales bacterium]|nr:cyclic nucleotide-binding domain-containing protein [Candidatus Limnocylindrales bacterium]